MGYAKRFLADKNVKLITVFGYGAPETDVEAVKLMYDAWGGNKKRKMEQFEIIDIREEDTVVRQWDQFIESHHYDYSNDFFKSSIATNPRRTSESYFQHIMPMTIDEAFSASNPVPNDFKTMEELWNWFKPLVDAEEKWKKERESNQSKN